MDFKVVERAVETLSEVEREPEVDNRRGGPLGRPPAFLGGRSVLPCGRLGAMACLGRCGSASIGWVSCAALGAWQINCPPITYLCSTKQHRSRHLPAREARGTSARFEAAGERVAPGWGGPWDGRAWAARARRQRRICQRRHRQRDRPRGPGVRQDEPSVAEWGRARTPPPRPGSLSRGVVSGRGL